MIKTKEVVIPASVQRIDHVDEEFCDKCGKNLDDEERGNFDVLKVVMYLEEGNHFPEGRMTTKTKIDCCSECFREYILPAIKELGFIPREVDGGW